ncbi:MAG: Na/Pi cotransporter family protein, partial [Ruminococcus sp.]|nr:Na/Pi cotransporter family protein [Candidatus Apopatosoma intestinale]
MSLSNWLTLLGGLSLFLFGMHQMGDALEKRAGNRLKIILGRLTSSPFKGFLLGLGVTAIIQSSCATTVMVVGFVNSGVMTLAQATGVIMGANLGTAITSWILSLTGIRGDAFLLQLVKPSTFTPIIAFVGIIMILFMKQRKKQDVGMILVGFSVLMFGMQTMSSSVDGLAEIPAFTDMLLAFSDPVIGVLVGIVFTAIIQSSSATVGILQALSMTGAVPFKTAIPLILGMNIGTCITALISSIGAT